MIPTPPNQQHHFPVGTPPQLGGGGSGGLSGGLEGMQWSQHQLLPQYSSGLGLLPRQTAAPVPWEEETLYLTVASLSVQVVCTASCTMGDVQATISSF